MWMPLETKQLHFRAAPQNCVDVNTIKKRKSDACQALQMRNLLGWKITLCMLCSPSIWNKSVNQKKEQQNLVWPIFGLGYSPPPPSIGNASNYCSCLDKYQQIWIILNAQWEGVKNPLPTRFNPSTADRGTQSPRSQLRKTGKMTQTSMFASPYRLQKSTYLYDILTEWVQTIF